MADSGDTQLAAFIDRIRALGIMPEAVAAAAAPSVQAAVRATAASGTDPYGKPWAPKRDGSRALVNAPGSITADAQGPVIVVKTTGPYAIHNNLSGDSRRQVIPDAERGIPSGVAAAIHRAATEVWNR